MLRNIRIQGFKSAASANLELGRFNVFVGPNGSGKTNLLEAIGMLGCAASGRVDHDAFRARGVRPGTPALYRTALEAQKHLERTIQLEAASDDEVTYRVSLSDPSVGRGKMPGSAAWRFEKEHFLEGDREVGVRTKLKGRIAQASGIKHAITQEHDRGIAPIVGPMRGNKALQSLLRTLDGFAIYTPFPPMLRAQLPDPGQKLPIGLMGGGLAEGLFSLQNTGPRSDGLPGNFAEELFKLCDWVDNLSFRATSLWPGETKRPRKATNATHLELRLRDRFLRSGVDWLSASEANEGALSVLFLLTLVFHPAAPRALAIDNVDQTLNPRLARYLLERVQALVLAEPKRPQMLVTTHNPLVLDALNLKDERVRLFLAWRDQKSGATHVEPFDAERALKPTNGGEIPLSRLWLSGALGAMPPI
jgi:predicted ATPase